MRSLFATASLLLLVTILRLTNGFSDPTRLSASAADKLTVCILLFENVEVLDFAGPFEVFSRTRSEAGPQSRRTDETAPFRVITVSKDGSKAPIAATGNLKVMADFGFSDCPDIDILVVPGGFGTRTLLEDQETIAWIQEAASRAKLTTSVCTGALLLAKAGLLSGKKVTTHWAALDLLSQQGDDIHVDRTMRWVEDGDVISSAGVAAGVDMAFHVVERLCGKEIADETAHYIEYPRRAATDPRSSA